MNYPKFLKTLYLKENNYVETYHTLLYSQASQGKGECKSSCIPGEEPGTGKERDISYPCRKC